MSSKKVNDLATNYTMDYSPVAFQIIDEGKKTFVELSKLFYVHATL